MSTSKPLILVTNDDGFHSKGIQTLVEAVSDLGQVLVVAPHLPQSGMGHAITINHPLRLQEVKDFGEIEAYSCTGTPVDCVKLAIYGILHRKPDLIVSGVNHGANFSVNVLYSGTMSAAVEGAIEGIPSVGFSLLDHSANADFSGCPKYIRQVVKKILSEGIGPHTCLNVNIPAIAEKDIQGVRICRQGVGHWEDEFIERQDPSGRSYYWMSGAFGEMDKSKDSDNWALHHHYVSIVPVQYDMTAYQEIDRLKSWDL